MHTSVLNYSLQSSRPKRVLNVFYRNVNCSFVVLLQIYHQQQQTASSVWDVLLVYCQHFLQSGFTSAKLYTTGLEIQNKKHAELYRQADILSLSLSLWHALFLFNLCPSHPSSHALFQTHTSPLFSVSIWGCWWDFVITAKCLKKKKKKPRKSGVSNWNYLEATGQVVLKSGQVVTWTPI